MATGNPPSVTIDAGVDWVRALSEHGRWLRTVVRARLGGAEDVDEVMQEVSLAAVSQRAPLADREKAGPWLYQVAVRQALLHRRSRGRRRRRIDRYAHREASRSRVAPDPLAWLMAEERDRMVREAVAELPPRDREVLMLKYTEGWSARELAERLGLTASAVEARLHRARAKLRGRLARLARDPDAA